MIRHPPDGPIEPGQALAELTWKDVEALDPKGTVLILPVGALEAHGPHLPLGTDVVIAEAMARAGAEKLAEEGILGLRLPSLAYSPAGFAASFPGTVSLGRENYAAQLVQIAASVEAWGLEHLVLANAHFDPGNLGGIYDALKACEERGLRRPIFPDVTRKPWALQLTDEFKSGACHAGRYEGSIVLAARPDLVRRELAEELPDHPVSLSDAIRAGQRDFRQAGGDQAYFGYPSQATAAEGHETIAVLGEILCQAVLQALGSPKASHRQDSSDAPGDEV
ncbi:MAG: creatininase family protein [Acidobacteriota bacterium]|nr:creatininase family protein [Acidobacteriota bacterium]